MSLSRVWLVRHAHTRVRTGDDAGAEWASHDLSRQGFDEARATSRRLSTEQISAVFSSTAWRSFRTAEVIARPHGLPVEPRQALDEFDYGAWLGQKPSRIRKEYPDHYKQWVQGAENIDIPGGESLAAAADRTFAELDRIADQIEGGEAVAVSHKTVIRLVICRVLGLQLSRHRNVTQLNCAVNVLLRSNGSWIVECTNDTYHLGPPRTRRG